MANDGKSSQNIDLSIYRYFVINIKSSISEKYGTKKIDTLIFLYIGIFSWNIYLTPSKAVKCILSTYFNIGQKRSID